MAGTGTRPDSASWLRNITQIEHRIKEHAPFIADLDADKAAALCAHLRKRAQEAKRSMWGGYKGRPVVDPHHPTSRDYFIHFIIVKSVLCLWPAWGLPAQVGWAGERMALLEMNTNPRHTTPQQCAINNAN